MTTEDPGFFAAIRAKYGIHEDASWQTVVRHIEANRDLARTADERSFELVNDLLVDVRSWMEDVDVNTGVRAELLARLDRAINATAHRARNTAADPREQR